MFDANLPCTVAAHDDRRSFAQLVVYFLEDLDNTIKVRAASLINERIREILGIFS
jgi:hypothetical protein